MNLRPALAALCMLALPAAYALTPADVSPGQIAGFKSGMDAGCREAGKKHGDSASHVEAVCGCLRQVLEESVTMENWRVAYVEDQAGHGEEVQKLLVAPNAEKLRACAAKP